MKGLMPIYKRIVCTDQVPIGNPPKEAKIVSVGIGDDPSKAIEKLPLGEVLRQMEQGVIFYTKGETSGKVALVHKYYCPRCGAFHIKSAPDAVWDNNLDSLRYCQWKNAA